MHDVAIASETCLGWSRDLIVPNSSLPNILPTLDGGIIVIGRGDVSIDAGARTHLGKNAGGFVASFNACGGTRYLVPVLMPHSFVDAATLDPSGTLYMAGRASETERRDYSWISRMDADSGRIVWYRQYTSEDTSFENIYPTDKGGLIAIAHVSGGLRIGNKTFGCLFDEDQDSCQPRTQVLLVFDGEGNLAFSETLGSSQHVLYPGSENVFISAQQSRISDYADAVEARAYDGRLLWRRSLDRAGFLASDPNGGLSQFIFRHPDCRDPSSRCSPSRMEKVSIDGNGQRSSLSLPDFGDGPSMAPVRQPVSARSRLPVIGRTAESPRWTLDSAGRSLISSGETDFTAYDQQGRLIRRVACCTHKDADRTVGAVAAWAADGAVFTAYMTNRTDVLRIARWRLDGEAVASSSAPHGQNEIAKAPPLDACPEGMAYIPPWVLPLPRHEPSRSDPSIHPYCMDILETTQAEYQACVKAKECTQAKPRSVRSGRSSYPVTGVTASQGDSYCRFRGKRLPTRAEWGRAALGDRAVSSPWEGAACIAVRGRSCCDRPLHEVGESSDVSPFGVRDIVENAREWICEGPPTGVCDSLCGDDWLFSSSARSRAGAGRKEYTGIRCASDAKGQTRPKP
jgi:hypothetical protein